MYRFRRGKKEEGNKEKSEKNTNPEEIRDDNNNNPESEQSNLKFNPNQNISFTKDIITMKRLSYSIATLDIIHLNFVVGFHLIALSI